jgi:hypothetical protein
MVEPTPVAGGGPALPTVNESKPPPVFRKIRQDFGGRGPLSFADKH